MTTLQLDLLADPPPAYRFELMRNRGVNH